MNKLATTSLALFVTTLGCLYACGSSTSGSCDETATCAPSSGGAPDGGGDVVGPPAGCDPSADPKDAPLCVVNEYALFVDATNGSDTNAGTRESPLKTINGAIAKVGAKPRIYVCEGTYAEHVKLTSAVSLFGGFACTSWTYTGTKAKVAPTDEGYALEISGVTARVVVSDLEVAAQAGTDASPSSVATFVSSSGDVTVVRSKLEAAAGFAGADGVAGTTGVPTPLNLIGNVGGSTMGGDEKLCTCSTGGTSKGGHGGNTGATGPDGLSGETAQATPSPAGATGAGGTRAQCENASPVSGTRGSDAPAAAQASSPALGTLDGTGWHPGDGASGTNGIPGQGGGGGGSYTADNGGTQNGGGGGGGCGGCGGSGGGGGKGGGASIALLVTGSGVKLVGAELIAANGGAGGAGKLGGDGQSGGNKGQAANSACVGGTGGTGGKGGAGAGGSGGVSAGVVYKGAKPTLDGATTITTGTAGTKGAGAGTNNDGLDGQKADTLEAQ
jgi:hypothetical protein